MTVTYTAEVATCRGLGCFWKLLFRWRGSIYKLLWPNLAVYSVVYFTLSGIYRFALSPNEREFFEKLSLHCQIYGDLIPIAFVLGFYVSIVIKRWWEQYICMPWPDNLAMFVSTLVHGQDERGRLMRRTIIRYVNLCLVITLRMMSPRVKKRFPTLDHLVEAGFMQPNEKKIFEDMDKKTTHPKYWMPLVWAGGIVTRARKEGRVKDDHATKTLIDELNTFRSGCGGMLNYDWISIPLVYTQVVTLAVYVYFIATLMSTQFLDPRKGYPKHEVDLVVPIFTFLQFFFYMGWLKVAESLVNPFGEDDDDFELNWLVDRNLQVSYVIVDEMHEEHPEMVKDQYWDEVFPVELPYTAASKQYQTGGPPVSTDHVEVSAKQGEFMPLVDVVEESEITTDERDDIEADLEMAGGGAGEAGGGGGGGSTRRRETHPVSIARRRKSKVGAGAGGTGSSVGSANTAVGSFSAPRTGRKSSVLNMLTRMFRRDESSKDLCSQLGSSVSLTLRGRGLRSSSRMSSMSQSQAQSRTSMVRENTYQDEMFRMSDVSLAGSANTTSSQIQITVACGTTQQSTVAPMSVTAPVGEGRPPLLPSAEPTELSRLLMPATAIAVPPRKYSRERPPGSATVSATASAAASVAASVTVAPTTGETASEGDDSSSASASAPTTDWNMADSSATATWSGLMQPSSPPSQAPLPRLGDSFKQRPFRRETVSPGEPLPSGVVSVSESVTRIVTPSSPPVRHSFAPLLSPTPPPPPLGSARRKRSTDAVAREAAAAAAAAVAAAAAESALGRRASDPRDASRGLSLLSRSLRMQQPTPTPPPPPPPTPSVTVSSPLQPQTSPRTLTPDLLPQPPASALTLALPASCAATLLSVLVSPPRPSPVPTPAAATPCASGPGQGAPSTQLITIMPPASGPRALPAVSFSRSLLSPPAPPALLVGAAPTAFAAASEPLVSASEPAETLVSVVSTEPEPVSLAGVEEVSAPGSRAPVALVTTAVSTVATPAVSTAAMTGPSLETESAPPPPTPYVSSPAIPVPAPPTPVAPPPAVGSPSALEGLMEAAMAPVSRRTLHDFHELEPISEHGEHSEQGEGSVAGDGSPLSHERLSARYDYEADESAGGGGAGIERGSATASSGGVDLSSAVASDGLVLSPSAALLFPQPPPPLLPSPPPLVPPAQARPIVDRGTDEGGGAGDGGGGGPLLRESTV